MFRRSDLALATFKQTSILQLAAGERVRSKGPSRKIKEERITKIEDKFDAGDYIIYTLVEYLSAICRWVGF